MKIDLFSGTAACLTLAGCAIKNPPAGSDILTSAAREQIPANWSGSHRSGAVAPGWIRTFRDPDLTASSKRRSSAIPTSKPPLRVWKRRATRCESPHPRSTRASRIKASANRQGQELGGDLGSGSTPPDFGGLRESKTAAAAPRTPADSSTQRWVYGLGIGAAWEADVWGRIRSKKAAAQAESDALEATTTNLPGSRSPPPSRTRTSPPSRPRNRMRTHRKH